MLKNTIDENNHGPSTIIIQPQSYRVSVNVV